MLSVSISSCPLSPALDLMFRSHSYYDSPVSLFFTATVAVLVCIFKKKKKPQVAQVFRFATEEFSQIK